MRSKTDIEAMNVSVYRIPTDFPEADGTLSWDTTTIVIVQIRAGGMEITAGEYGYDLNYFRGMLDEGAVDVLMADGTRCAGITGFLGVDRLCQSYGLPLSAHTAPSVHIHPCCAAPSVRHIEYFHDHVRIEKLLFDGAIAPVDGVLYPDLSRAGLGLELKLSDAKPYAV